MRKAIAATCDSLKFMQDICAAMDIDPADVTRITVEVSPDQPLIVTFSLLGDEKLQQVEFPTVEHTRLQTLLEESRAWARENV